MSPALTRLGREPELRAFNRGANGFSSWLEPWERAALLDLVQEVAAVLAPAIPQEADAGDGSGPGQAAGGQAASRDVPPGVREGESLADAGILAALDFQPGPTADPGVVAAADPALELLLPASSPDPQLAAETAAMTREPLRQDKRNRLLGLEQELLEPTGPQGAVLVTDRLLPQWLGALNDLRLFLSQRLEILTAQDAEAVHEQVLAPPSPRSSPEAQLRYVQVVLYEMVTWWQESLLSAVEEN